jgi:signal transduction histidine kinase
VLLSLWILVFAFIRYRKSIALSKKLILLFSFGTSAFLLSFFLTVFIADYLIINNITDSTNAYNFEQYGLFGMTAFMGFLAYLIVKYKAFDIKLLGVQALVVAQFIAIASMFAFTTSATNQILIGVTLTGTTIMGWYMVRSVKAEVKRKEELQLMSEKLSQANDQLRKLDNAKSEFISIASHQLRTPLTAIKGFVSLILEGTYGEVLPQVREALNKVYLSGERLINLVENLLSISRIESGRMEYQKKLFRLEDMLKELVDNFTIIAMNKGLKLEMELPKDPLPEIMADQIKIREVISNFIDNALKYTNEGKVVVRA